MSTIIIITPPKKPQVATVAEKKAWDEQLKKDCRTLEAAGFKVQYFQTE